MKFIVTGTPRSATKYAACLLTEAGAACSHEWALQPTTPAVDVLRWFGDDTPSESSWMAWMLQPLLPKPIPVLHTIRDPWKVIDSLSNRNSILDTAQLPSTIMIAIRDTIAAYLPDVFAYSNRVDMAAAFVTGWNRLIADAVPERFVYYPERLDADTLRAMLQYIEATEYSDDLAGVIARSNTRTNEGYTVNDIPEISDPIVAAAIQQYATDNGFTGVFVRKIENVTDHQTPEQLAEAMDPALLDRVNQHAVAHGFAAVELAAV